MTMPNGNQGRKLRVIEAAETIEVKHPIFTLFGQPGVCKTSLGFSAEKAILLNFDTESAIARAVNRGPAMNVLTFEELRELEAGSPLLDPFATIVIDPVGSCVNLMAADMIDKTPRLGRDGNPTIQGWGVLKSRFRDWMTKLRQADKDILLIAHHREDKNGDMVFVRPDIAGGSKDEVMRLSDFVGYVHMKGNKRVLDFSPSEEWFGKNPAQWPTLTIPEPAKARTFMAGLFADGRAALSKASEASAAVASQVQDFRTVFSDYKTVQEFNTAIIAVLKALPEGVKQQVGKVLLDVAEKRGLRFDRERKVFVQPEAVPVVASASKPEWAF